jgi:hypothetical protein
MSRVAATVGFAAGTTETKPGIFEDSYVEHELYGITTRFSANFSQPEKEQTDFTLGYNLSLFADAYTFENFTNIRYVLFGGSKWRVSVVSVERPKILIELGGLYHD